MQGPEQRYYELAEKWLNGTITETEKEQFLKWYNDDMNDPSVVVPAEFAAGEEELKSRILSRIQKEKRPRIVPFGPARKYWLAAASVVLLLGISTLLFLQTKSPSVAQGNDVPINSKPQTVGIPDGNKAMLTLGDGSTIVLDTMQHGLIANDKNSRVIKLGNGQLAYQAAQQQSSEPVYNVLRTPVGGQYEVVLADGTKVWLNSSSSLRFPTAFAGSERIVELKGEGYFEVAKNKQIPFNVKVGEMKVRVLGTHFNVMAYDDEEAVRTTLLEGSVRVEENDRQQMIVPGEQVSRNKEGKLRVNKGVNTEQIVAWKNGLFQFDQTDLASVLRQIARWYDVQIINEERIEGHFSGTITKHVRLEKVLHMLELTGTVHFTVKGRQIFVHR